MKITITVAAAMLSAAGCALVPVKYPKKYTHATKSAEQFTADRYECETIAKRQAAEGTLMMGLGNPITTETHRCLREMMGWVPAAE